ncbi:hypothetical protein [Hymenobacter montanus]|nr:hypothetical protein [Hymenobacter montanus]
MHRPTARRISFTALHDGAALRDRVLAHAFLHLPATSAPAAY